VTRVLRPPLPIAARCDADGQPVGVRGLGPWRRVTHVARHWEQHRVPAVERGAGSGGADLMDPAGLTGPDGDRAYYRIVADGLIVWDIFAVGGRWYLERIVT